jgi:DNA-binding NtrC family response regulator
LNVRFIAATNQDIESMAVLGTFRRDLLFRLNVARVELPPLRARKDDIPLLLQHYSKKFGSRDARPAPRFSER